MRVAVIAAILTLNINAQAQKKADIQPNDLPPAGLKVDGNLSEWDQKAFVTEDDTKLSYIISNDSENLYLSLKTSDKEKVTKIISRGISFTVNKDAKKKDGASITYPVTKPQKAQIAPGNLNQSFQTRLAESGEIRVRGLQSIMDGGIAVINEYGIRAAAALDSANLFTYELAVPLQQLGLSASSFNPFAVNIRINGIVMPRLQTGPRSPYESMRMGGYNRASIPAMYKPEEFWIFRTLKTNNRVL